jgi:hypothetical protein
MEQQNLGMVQIRLTEKKVAHKPNLCDTEFGKTKKAQERSRQTIYKIAEKGKTLLIQGMEPGRHGARIEEKRVRVNWEHVERSTVVLTEAGVSQRDISICLEL